jgi:hypothetical protein
MKIINLPLFLHSWEHCHYNLVGNVQDRFSTKKISEGDLLNNHVHQLCRHRQGKLWRTNTPSSLHLRRVTSGWYIIVMCNMSLLMSIYNWNIILQVDITSVGVNSFLSMLQIFSHIIFKLQHIHYLNRYCRTCVI